MPTLFPSNLTVCNYISKPSYSNKFIFPITGLTIENKLSIGNVHFYNCKGKDFLTDEILGSFRSRLSILTDAKTIVYVDVSSADEKWKSICDDNISIALMMIKQCVGLLYLTYYELRGYNDQRRIIISLNNKHESEEGMEYYLTETSVMGSNVSDSLFLIVDDKFDSILQKRISRFLSFYKMDCEMDLIKLKLYESLYYLCNEIHSIERILKMSAFLNLTFIMQSSDENFPSASKKIRLLLQRFNIEINLFGRTGKLNDILNSIYSNIRNQYSHGKINLYKEYNVISLTDYFIFYQVYMNILLLLSYRIELQDLHTTKEVLAKIVSYNPEQQKKIK